MNRIDGQDSSAGGCSSTCPAPELLIDLVEGRIDAPARAALLDRIAACPGCSAALRVVSAMHATLPEDEAADLAEAQAAAAIPQAAVPQRVAARRRPQRWMAIAAALVGIAVALPLLWLGSQPPTVEPVRSVATAVIPADGARLDEFPLRWSWPGAAQALAYTVSVYGERGQLLARFEVSEASLRFDRRPDSLPASGRLVWEVSAQLPQGVVPLGSWHFTVG